ncbi:hypothetical protein BD310DRAFT_932415 [Dichomitus squalens]|uniref:Uncharacterized protein n=1 Tax=Dichomitus squalens TaxID=114155 RepID=A0A4Q9PPB1_9APHY|nr:hypothetical protein BD310DRAFT_932415 [Dichomitus squalens]
MGRVRVASAALGCFRLTDTSNLPEGSKRVLWTGDGGNQGRRDRCVCVGRRKAVANARFVNGSTRPAPCLRANPRYSSDFNYLAPS